MRWWGLFPMESADGSPLEMAEVPPLVMVKVPHLGQMSVMLLELGVAVVRVGKGVGVVVE